MPEQALMSPRLSQPLWYVAQIAAIAGLTYLGTGRTEENPPPLTPGLLVVGFGISVIFVALGTAIVTRLLDWTNRKLKRLPVAAAVPAPSEHDEPIQQRDCIGAGSSSGEVRKTPSSLWRGQ